MNVKRFPLVYGRLAELSITQKQLADKIEISSVSLSNKLTGKTEFNLSEIYKICEALQIPKDNIISYFFG